MRRAMRAFGLWLLFSFTVAPLALVTMAAMLATLIAVAVALGNAYGPSVGLFLTGSGFAASYFIAVGAHEAGHVLGGGLVGWTARLVRVGPVTWTRRGERWRLRWTLRANWLTGRVETVLGPPDPWRLVLFLLAGPGANFVIAVVAGGIFVTPIPLLPRCTAGLLALTSMSLGIWSLVPLRERGQASDGLSLWRLLSYGALPLTFNKMAFEPVAPRSIRLG